MCITSNQVKNASVTFVTGFYGLSTRGHDAIAGKELSLSNWCIASLCIYNCSTVFDLSSEKYSGSTGHRKSWYQQRNFQ